MSRSDNQANAETELKLAASPEDFERIRHDNFVLSNIAGSTKTKHLQNIYFDTPDQKLRRKGYALRVRSDGQKLTQTLKSRADTNNSLLTRGEWEAPVKSLKPDLTLVEDQSVRDRIGLILPGDLQPIFENKVERYVGIVNASVEGKTRVLEIAFDRGEVSGGKNSEQICEIELELLRGDTATLYDFALELSNIATVRLETQSKSDRGYALSQGVPPGWYKAKAVSFDPDVSVDTAMEMIFRACLGHWSTNVPAAIDGTDPEGVHQARVGLRRFRSALAVFAGFIPDDQLTWLKAGAKAAINALGPARDWDVFVDELLMPVMASEPSEDMAALHTEALAMRANGRALASAALQSSDYSRFVLSVGAWIENRGWQASSKSDRSVPLRSLANALLSKRLRRSKKLGRGFKSLSTDARHEVRISLKKLRYASEFFRSLYDQDQSKAYIQVLSRMQDLLGHLNDVAVSERLLNDLLKQRATGPQFKPIHMTVHVAAGRVQGWYAHRVSAGEADILERWNNLVTHRPFWDERD